MAFYVITDRGVINARSLQGLEKQGYKFDEVEFKPCGPDSVVQCSDADLSFVQDKKRLSLIPFERLYKKDNSIKLLFAVNFILQLILLAKK